MTLFLNLLALLSPLGVQEGQQFQSAQYQNGSRTGFLANSHINRGAKNRISSPELIRILHMEKNLPAANIRLSTFLPADIKSFVLIS